MTSTLDAAPERRQQDQEPATTFGARAVMHSEVSPEGNCRQPTRYHVGHSDTYIPTCFRPENGTYDLMVHFHGVADAQEANVERAGVNAVVVSINVGIGSGPYEDAFKEQYAWTRLLGQVDGQVRASGRAPGARLGRIALSAWSAGYGAVGSLLRNPNIAKTVDAVLLADGLHANFKNEKTKEVDVTSLRKYAKVAQAAVEGNALFAMTHSSITVTGYANSTETAGALLQMLSVDKTENDTMGPRGMHEIYEAHRGNFHAFGYTGVGKHDHINHIRGMGDTIYPYLAQRWSEQPAAPVAMR